MNTVRCGSSAMMSMTLLSVFVLVQILCVYGELTTVAVTGEVSSATDKNTCEKIRIKCAYHEGCYHALQNYFEKCDRILRADSKTCPEPCMHALVTLTSTEQGSGLLDCTCKDHYCEEMKARVEVCRPHVIEAAKNETVVPCELAQWICQVDPTCSLAVNFFQRYCKRMLQGEWCSERCLNSAEILQRQEKAIKMNRCQCTGQATVECLRNKERMARLCYGVGSDLQHPNGGTGSNKSKKNLKKHRPKMFEMDPDRAEIEMMIANADYEPEGWHGMNNSTFGAGVYNSGGGDGGSSGDNNIGDGGGGGDDDDDDDDDDDGGGWNGSAPGVRADVTTFALVTAVFLVTLVHE